MLNQTPLRLPPGPYSLFPGLERPRLSPAQRLASSRAQTTRRRRESSEDSWSRPRYTIRCASIPYRQQKFVPPKSQDPPVLKIVRRSNPYYLATTVVFHYLYRFPASFAWENKDF